MPTIALRLEPGRLRSPDLDLRYALPDALERETRSRARSDGYDYGRRTDAIVCFLAVAEPADLERCVAEVVAFLERETLLGCPLRSVIVGVSDEDHAARDEAYRHVHPEGARFTLE